MNSKIEALQELEHQMGLLKEIHDECAGIIEEHFPEEAGWAKAYAILDFGWSGNPYDNTLEKLIENGYKRLEEDENEY